MIGPEDHETINELCAVFLARLPERLAEIDRSWEGARPVGERGVNPVELQRFHRLVHSLSGAGATFGFPEVTTAARRLERHLLPLIRQPDLPAEAAGEIDSLLEELRRASQEPPGPPLLPPDQ